LSVKHRKRKIRAEQRPKKQGKTLTFVDMSNLSYLSKTISADTHLTSKIAKVVFIPTSTKIAIIEDDSEEDDESGNEKEEITTQVELTVSYMCR
jgi:hypothetical protein